MDIDKFNSEVATLKKFFELYCKNNHKEQLDLKKIVIYKQDQKLISLNLCKECETLLSYSINKLQNCSHKIKPRCRVCPNVCYEKEEWKKLSKIMKYSAINLGFSKIKTLFRSSK